VSKENTTKETKPETEENTTEEIILASRKGVFKVTLVYATLAIIIIAAGLIIAIIFDDTIGTLVIVFCTLMNTPLMALAMYFQTKPLQIEMDRLKALKESEDE